MPNLLDDAKDTFTHLEELGFIVPSGSRYDVHKNRIKAAAAKINRNAKFQKEEYLQTCISVSETRELSSIIRHLHRLPEWKEGFHKLLSGNPSPINETNPTARSFQFELYIASRAEAAGLNPVSQEPDLKFSYDGHDYSIAAKRINSHKKISARVSEAAKQIDRHGLPGFIFVEVSKLFAHQSKFVLGSNREAMEANLANNLRDVAYLPILKAANRLRSQNILGILIFCNFVAFDDEDCVPIDMPTRLSIISPNTHAIAPERAGAIMRSFFREDGSMSSHVSRPDLATDSMRIFRSQKWSGH